ncbi:glycosyltransferase family 2 protein [Desulfopila sp. IMCC35008]|uniref:glycosyltransferase family 2 protein n=1 Tax=Desulfopila sp. IMCC35008 TaxID=2653858 RepID=UPI001F0DEED8|nr:glycosyltransferase family 2 protein [Desulfopila sp. IMCC35008]
MLSEILFWSALTFIFYAYVGYPILITLLSFIVNSKVDKSDIEPSVTLLITAYNEEKDIALKLDNSLALDYPNDKFEIVVASDGSTDATDDIVRSYQANEAGVKVVLHRVEGRVGKTQTQNSAVKICSGDILIFSDAASMYEKDVIRAFVRNYADPKVGAVSGMYTYEEKKGASVGLATIIFWKLENFIKSRQTKIRTITGCCGCIYSLRKNLYVDLPATIISDLVEPLMILQKGYRIVFEPEALALEETAGKTADEFKMRIRVIVRGMTGMLFARNLYNPFRYPFVALQLISHKVMRWLVPVFCLIALGANASLLFTSPFYTLFFAGQLLFYAFALIGYFLEKKGIHMMIFYLPLYFCIVNAASLISMFKVIKGENIVTWQTQR